tara:strand:+ start:159 stop:506 length:348 start_codon:yes stop_codon:yes gene_type:complete
MSFIDLPDTTPPASQLVAQNLLRQINEQLESRVNIHKGAWFDFWQNSTATPDDILENMGTSAALWLNAARENVTHLHRLALLVGKTVADYLPTEMLNPPREFVTHQDSTVTLTPP